MNKILIANRGEIAVRVMRACRELGLRSVAVYSECDRTAVHVRYADEAYAIGLNPPADSYLRIDRLIDAAKRSGADAVHPGYGFLAENAAFAGACQDCGLTFIGPSPEVIGLMGSKTAARAVAERSGVPVVPGTTEALPATASDDELLARASEIGYPLFVKAVSGGGGKGIRSVEAPAALLAAIRTARSEAGSSFGDSAVYFERRLIRPRHVEVQLLGDQFGTVLPFVERECSIQRRHQKLIEETPSPAVSGALRDTLTSAAARIARAVGYVNAGTIEFLVDGELNEFYFLEMNTRLQVEHPITELVSGVDLVAWQIAIARGDRLTLDPDRLLVPNGHAMECRVYAEDPAQGFLPSPGRVSHLRSPSGPGVRDDGGVVSGSEIPIFYDALISKVASWGPDRPVALARMTRAIREYEVRGVRTTLPFFQWILQEPAFRAARVDTTFVDRALEAHGGRLPGAQSTADEPLAAMAVALRMLDGRAQAASARPNSDMSTPAGWREFGWLDALRDWPPASAGLRGWRTGRT